MPLHPREDGQPTTPRALPRLKPRLRTCQATRTWYIYRKEARQECSANQSTQNGDYPDPNLTSALPIKRQFRDPYADWWDPIERRNYGETIHEDNDILGAFTTEAYTHFTPGWGGVLVGCFVASVGVLMGVVYQYYPDRVSRAHPNSWAGSMESTIADLHHSHQCRGHSQEDWRQSWVDHEQCVHG